MKYRTEGARLSCLKLLTVSALSMVLVACGGGTSGDATDSGATDLGLDDGGLTDDFGLDDGGATDDFGLDGGLTDGGTDDGFVSGVTEGDRDGNGIPDIEEPCLGFDGTDPDSSNFSWNDNCQMRADADPNDGVLTSPGYNSTYSEGIQRVLRCSGAAGAAASTAAFADGFFGPNTGEAVRTFQRLENEEVMARQAAGLVEAREILVVDGIVGPQTWARLQTKVEDNVDGAFITNEDIAGDNYDVFGVLASTYDSVAAVDCSNERNFLGFVGADSLIGAWRLTNVPGGTGINSFSIDTP